MSFPSGLKYVPKLISEDEQKLIENFINSQEWDTSLKRLTQHYGYKYNYSNRNLDPALPIPDILMDIWKKYVGGDKFPEQCIINNYEPGEGISAHTDDVYKFSDTVVIFSFISPYEMNFTNEDDKFDLLLEPGSLLVMTGEARYKWKHSIAARKSDIINGKRINRGRRISVTFRWKK